MTVGRPRPVPSAETRPFWDALQAGQLIVRRCGPCQTLLHPKRIRCPRCLSETSWQRVSGRATVTSWTVLHRAFLPGFDAPYVVGQVRLAEDPALILDTNLELDAEHLSPGLPVTAVFRRQDGFTTHTFTVV